MFKDTEILRLENYLRHKLGNAQIQLKARAKTGDSVEILLAGEFLGVIYKDQEDGEISYDLNMAILESDLPDAA